MDYKLKAIIKGSQVGTHSKTPETGTLAEITEEWFVAHGFLSLLSYTIQAHLPRCVVSWTLTHQSVIKEMSRDLPVDQSNADVFSIVVASSPKTLVYAKLTKTNQYTIPKIPLLPLFFF